MVSCLLELTKPILCVLICHGKIIVDFVKFLSLFLGFDGYILSYMIDIIHDCCNSIDLLLSFVDNARHQISLIAEFRVDFDSLKLLLVFVFFFYSYSICHKLILIYCRVNRCHTLLCTFNSQLSVLDLFFFNSLSNISHFSHQCLVVILEGFKLISLRFDHVWWGFCLAILADFCIANSHGFSSLLKYLLDFRPELGIVDICAYLAIELLQFLELFL